MPVPEDEARRRLLTLRGEAEQRLQDLERSLAEVVAAAAGATTDDEHDPEGTTIGFERAQLTALARHARSSRTDVDAALARLAAGTYGVCGRCGGPIAPARLEARPTATTCVRC